MTFDFLGQYKVKTEKTGAFEALSYCCEAQPFGELDDCQGRCEKCREMSIFYYKEAECLT